MTEQTRAFEPVGGWTVDDVQDDAWLTTLTPADYGALIDAARRAAGRDLVALEAADLPLGRLAAVVDRLVADLTPGLGRGFALLRGLPVAEIGKDVAARVFWGVGLRLGEPVSQNLAGEFLCHVRKDSGVAYRGFASDVELGVHCDLTEIAGLCALVGAKTGGDSALVSLGAVHDALATESPELLEVLYEPFYHWRLDEQHAWERPFSIHPVFARGTNGWGAFFNPGMLGRTGGVEGVPRLTPLQRRAVDAMAKIADRPELRLAVRLEPGDMLFMHNALVAHARTSFVDDEDPERRRHLYRLWLDRPAAQSTVPWPVRYDFRYGNSGLTRRGVAAGQEAVQARLASTPATAS